MEFVIGALILLVILFFYGYFTKKNHFKEIDRLEEWKIDIMNRPILEEMSKVKQLNMTGQTEEMFERWRQSWDEIVAIQLPDVEELLFDAEEYADKYRFKKSKEVQNQIDSSLKSTEEQIDTILAELKELVGSEEKNRTEITELQESYRHVKKQMLAHRHVFGIAASALEKQLEQIGSQFSNFELLTENGDYLDAREVLLSIRNEIDGLNEKMVRIPDLITECQTLLPSQLDELTDGYREMESTGYHLDHIAFTKEIDRMKEELKTYIDFVQKAELDDVTKGLAEMKERIEGLYDALENEVHSKHFLIQNDTKTKTMLDELEEAHQVLRNETEFVQQSYHLVEEELNVPKGLEKRIYQLINKYDHFEIKSAENAAAHSMMKEELQDIREELEMLQKEQKDFSDYLQNLRKDEITARETVTDLRKKISEASRQISKSNIPGLPSDYLSLLEQSEDHIQDVIKSLNEKPLNIKSVQEHLYIASDTVQHFYDKTMELIENVMLAEKVIQYGNRFRSRYSFAEERLRTAEDAFRSYEYRAALEQAATTIEEIEPGSLKKIEESIKQELEN
ncbi:septation ring formation regulator EzrA [Falsibacillus albus]|uniref:Septation ring formation regulator EzrA n=1 Tax=Falsibacillus albus TaxID=2478915 RepID=A0A3L7K5K3_9BACI|nr:septation ring formation regulator EzrA [Falsibacillus albus]RLQ97925.1 septation ring formation regulator EzrA [Falsibacillus albus]